MTSIKVMLSEIEIPQSSIIIRWSKCTEHSFGYLSIIEKSMTQEEFDAFLDGLQCRYFEAFDVPVSK